MMQMRLLRECVTYLSLRGLIRRASRFAIQGSRFVGRYLEASVEERRAIITQ